MLSYQRVSQVISRSFLVFVRRSMFFRSFNRFEFWDMKPPSKLEPKEYDKGALPGELNFEVSRAPVLKIVSSLANFWSMPFKYWSYFLVSFCLLQFHFCYLLVSLRYLFPFWDIWKFTPWLRWLSIKQLGMMVPAWTGPPVNPQCLLLS